MTPNGFMFRGICPTEVYDKIMSLKVDKSALDIPRRCIKYAANHIYEALRADVSKYRPEAYKSEKLKNPKEIHRVALVELLSEIYFLFLFDDYY